MNQSGKPLFTAGDKDVYALTDKGNEQLREAGTRLSQQELGLLVRLDGRAALGQIAAGMQTTATALSPLIGKFLHDGLIDVARVGDSDMIEFDAMFSTGSFASPSAMAMSDAEREASAGEAALKRNGYYARIARSSGRERKLAEGEKLVAVVVEDEPYLAKFIAQYLALERFVPRIAANRDEIVAALRKPPVPDIVLLDVTLPDVDGFNVLAKIRQHPVLKSVPVVMLTAHATREAVLKGLAGGADGYITKPVEPDTLIEAVKTVIGLPKK
ncbi:MAG TPA: response regulator [Burkholderiales bacterium]|nr:response regulator [Burkholderiales bacterium]